MDINIYLKKNKIYKNNQKIKNIYTLIFNKNNLLTYNFITS